MKRPFVIFAACLALCLTFSDHALAADAWSDPVLKAMSDELARSKAKLKLDQMAPPYYIEYRINDIDTITAEASFGALRTNVQTRLRFLRVVVRVGDYKQDSFFGQGKGVVQIMPLEDNALALRHQIWLATDQAYKAATEALSAKRAQLKQFHVDEPVDDFAHSDPVQSVRPIVTLSIRPEPWLALLEEASALYQTDPQIESFSSNLNFQAVNRYFVNSEGSVVRSGQTLYEISLGASTQAPDGMRLERSWGYTFDNAKDLPSREEFLTRGRSLCDTLRQLRAARVSDEEYRGPVIFSADASSSLLLHLVGDNVLGVRPEPGKPARTTGEWASSYKSRVLPEFLSVADDPTLTTISGKSLMGHYEVDDEGTKAARVSLIENGKLLNYLIGREPIRDFPVSNGHGRARVPTNYPGPSLGNLIVTATPSDSPDNLKKKMLEICKQRDLPYGFYVETVTPNLNPRLLYKVYASDGHQELVRGAVFGDLDLRSLRNNLIAAGNDLNVENHVLNVPHSIANPSLLFDELEIKRANINKETLPEYSAPPIASK